MSCFFIHYVVSGCEMYSGRQYVVSRYAMSYSEMQHAVSGYAMLYSEMQYAASGYAMSYSDMQYAVSGYAISYPDMRPSNNNDHDHHRNIIDLIFLL